LFSLLRNRSKKKEKKKKIPVQIKPSPEYPEVHSQLKLPIVFVHLAFVEHPPLFVKHSLISIDLIFFFLGNKKK